MSNKLPMPVVAVIIAVVVIVIGFIGYKALVPETVHLKPGTVIPPPPGMPMPRK